MKPWLKLSLKIVGGIVGVVLVLLLGVVVYVQTTWDMPVDRPVREMTAPRDSATIALGEFLFKYSAQCWACHSAEKTIDELPSGGAAEDLTELGFGKFYMKNITPDDETGIGTWTDGEIVRAIREGIGKDGRTFFIMPSRVFNKMSDSDALAMAAYLKSLPPVKNPLPPHEYGFLIKVLYAFNLIKPQPVVSEPVPTPLREVTAEWGKYVANHRSTCSDCHTHLDINTGTFYEDSLFMGSSVSFQQPFGKVDEEKIEPIWTFGRNLTPDPETGIGNWTEEDFVVFMKSGLGPDGKVRVASGMPYAYYTRFDEGDLRAMFRYFQSLQPVRRPTPSNIIYSKDITEGSGVPRGKALFRAYCQPCHGENGNGAPATKVKLAEVAASIDEKTLQQFIRDGQVNLFMPPFGNTLTAGQIDDVIAFIRTWEQKTSIQ